MRTKRTLLLAAAATLALAVPASAITNGTRDDADEDTHDGVGQLLFHVPSAVDSRFDDPGSWFTCTGTLISAEVVVTAGHCTYAIGVDGAAPEQGEDPGDKPTAPNNWEGGTDVWISFAQESNFDIFAGIESSKFADAADDDEGVNGNADRYAAWSAALDAEVTWNRATAYSHPAYIDAAFFLYDLGVLQLDEPVDVPEAEWGTLPEDGYLDAFQNTRRTDPDAYFRPVGFGIQEIVPRFESEDVRYEATARLVTTEGTHGIDGILPGTSVVFSNNNGEAARGGTCFGDSGGPYFVGDSMVIGAVTSYGVSPNCTGTGGGYRIDKADDLGFIDSFPRTPETDVLEDDGPTTPETSSGKARGGPSVTNPTRPEPQGHGDGKPAERPATAATTQRGNSLR